MIYHDARSIQHQTLFSVPFLLKVVSDWEIQQPIQPIALWTLGQPSYETLICHFAVCAKFLSQAVRALLLCCHGFQCRKEKQLAWKILNACGHLWVWLVLSDPTGIC